MTGVEIPYTPFGRFVHVPPPLPRADWAAPEIPWWLDSSKCIGKISKKIRKIKIINTLTKDEHVLEVLLLCLNQGMLRRKRIGNSESIPSFFQLAC